MGIKTKDTINIFLSRNKRRCRSNLSRLGVRIFDAIFGKFYFLNIENNSINFVLQNPIDFKLSKADWVVANKYLNHYFDLLGSDWVQVSYGMSCAGFLDVRYDPGPLFSKSWLGKDGLKIRNIRSHISPRYIPIDWQVDFKSGYRWSENKWYRNISYEKLKGVDIKVPWELSRLQHLPLLAATYADKREDKWAIEIIDQTLDWISANPPRYGVNWACTMDVSIRVVNILIAIDILRSSGYRPSIEVEKILTASIYSHAKHISANLEWSEVMRGNHYLANIAGLLVTSIYLPSSDETNAWIMYSTQEIMIEMERQFLHDGGHFEASTCYHSFCMEMIAVAILFSESIPTKRLEIIFDSAEVRFWSGAGLRKDTYIKLKSNYYLSGSIFSNDFHDKFLSGIHFIADVLKPNGHLPQIGDNDSGRFIGLLGSYFLKDFEGILSLHKNFNGALGWIGLLLPILPTRIIDAFTSSYIDKSYEIFGASILQNCPKNRYSMEWNNPRLSFMPTFDGDKPTYFIDRFIERSTHKVASELLIDGAEFLNGLELYAYQDFGLYIFKSKRIYLSIRCGYAKWDSSGCHAHEDQLSLEIMIDGKSISRDPGTYVYTPSRHLRNLYRSSATHVAPYTQTKKSQLYSGDSNSPPFSPPRHYFGKCIKVSEKFFFGISSVDGGEVMRKVELYDDRLAVTDYYRLDESWYAPNESLFSPFVNIPFSPGYGHQ
ncbi:heparinase II/III family protein [Polynucleobacter sp. AM-7D1]|uniref:heparinase II/III family protein n=1 Tax=Polynucleobacter sp. AM-7D1 TaxID=2689102 RepID=UPI001BFE8D06|nr:heparinase II/III family protein [Polynucleobacter sp. AM-7D1]QWE29001.1 heparinase II/III family protein [Polynucleobacter sp. AM-7D1]